MTTTTTKLFRCDCCGRETENRPVEVKYRVGEEIHTSEHCCCDECDEEAWAPDSWEGME
jgi:hypothetical protein